nr:LCP family protein [Lysinibacillus timonensis]
METRTKRRKNKNSKKIFLYSFLGLLTLLISYVGIQYYSFQQALSKMNTLEGNTPVIDTPDKTIHKEPFSVLLLGVDERENDVGRTDTMIVITVNPNLGTIKMLSIPRDARVEIIGNNTTEKINHAYARGGIPMSIDTVENLLNIPIDYYVSVNMEGFLSVIDAVGGIEVENDIDLFHKGYNFPKGKITLNGDEALVYSRIRKEDPRGDFGRQIRQKQLLEALFAEVKNPQIVLQLNEIFNILGSNVKMNFTMKEITEMPELYNQLDKSIEQIQFEQGYGQFIGELWYYILDENEVAQVSKELNEHLEIE